MPLRWRRSSESRRSLLFRGGRHGDRVYRDALSARHYFRRRAGIVYAATTPSACSTQKNAKVLENAEVASALVPCGP
jgi:hypothetical protein